MVSVMVPPIGTVVAGVNRRKRFKAAPACNTCSIEVMELNSIPVMAAASNPGVNVVSALDESRKPPATIPRALPRVSPVSVMVIAAVPVAAPAVVSTISVLAAVAAGVEVAAKDPTVLAMEVIDPKK